jgi:pullulanase/glycogen debranching enzyme
MFNVNPHIITTILERLSYALYYRLIIPIVGNHNVPLYRIKKKKKKKKKTTKKMKKRKNEETKKRRNEETKKRRNEKTKKRKNEETKNKKQKSTLTCASNWKTWENTRFKSQYIEI